VWKKKNMTLGSTVTSNDTLHVEKPQVKYLQGFGAVLQAQTKRKGGHRVFHKYAYSCWIKISRQTEITYSHQKLSKIFSGG
jgi:hypothetical protein